MKVAVIGATGLVGSEILTVLAEHKFPISTLIPVASEKSQGKELNFQGQNYKVYTIDEAITLKPDLALFSAGGSVALQHAPRFAAIGAIVIDNSSAWRMDPTKKLIVPEVNAAVLDTNDRIIANPNCSTIQMVMVLHPLHKAFKVKRVVASTYQSVTGTGAKAVAQLMNERKGIPTQFRAYSHPIDMNLIPQIDIFYDNGYTKEEMKMTLETKKIMGDDNIHVTATAVRAPVMGGHSEALNIEFNEEFELAQVRQCLAAQAGVVVLDDLSQGQYPMPIHTRGKDEVFVGRIRRDESQPKTLNLWVVADNLRKGAATNAVQIAAYMKAQGLLKSSS